MSNTSEQTARTACHDLADYSVVHELFDMAAQEILFRIVQVSRHVMQADKARDMDDALARHLARALMGENPEFKPVPEWSGAECAASLINVEPKIFEKLRLAEKNADFGNPRFLMVLATTAFYRAVYQAIEEAVNGPEASEASVRTAIAAVVDRFALAACCNKAARA